MLIFSGKGGFGNTKFIAFEKLAWHYECFICAMCKESMVGKGKDFFIVADFFSFSLYFFFLGFIQDEGNIICPECARKKMLEEMEAESQD